MTPIDEPFFPTVFTLVDYKPISAILPILFAIALYTMRNETGIKIWFYRLFAIAYILTYLVAVYYHFTL